MTADHYNQVQQLNRSPLGRLAERLLLAAKAEANPAYLYPLQLVLHVLEQHPETVPDPAGKDPDKLQRLTYAALDGPPLENLDRLLNRQKELSIDQASQRLAKELSKASAQEAGATLAENLFWNLAEEFPQNLGPLTEN